MRIFYLIPLSAAIVFATPKWKPLFNGTSYEPDLKVVGAGSIWSIDPSDSSIHGFTQNKNTAYTMIFTKANYDQFTVKYSYRLKVGCSGFFFRTKETAAEPYVEGCQVEAKYEAGQKEFGSLYCHPTPGWVRETDAKFSTNAARPDNQYQDVILTVKSPYVYVNINGKQAIGAGTASQALGGKAAWDYNTNAYSKTAGKFGLQIHGNQLNIDVNFKNIAILTGCGDATSPKYDGATVANLPEQPAVYMDSTNTACASTGIEEVNKSQLLNFIGPVAREGQSLSLKVSYTGSHTLEIVSMNGKVVFSGSAPTAFEYHIANFKNPGLYVARIKTEKKMAAKRIVVP